MKWLLAILALAVTDCSAESSSTSEKDVTTNSIGMKLKLIPAGNFMMGSEEGEGHEKPVHQVTLTKPFLIGVYEVTQEQYERVMGSNPSLFVGANRPVERASWDDAVAFCKKLSELPGEKAAGHVYRLPTEAEWEYACRAGTTTKFGFGDDESQVGEYAWFFGNSEKTTHPVGERKPNAWGLYDMHGNAFEWCQDWYGDYPSVAAADPTGDSSGSVRVARGGSWSYTAKYCRSSFRFGSFPSSRYYRIGFRVAIAPSSQPSE